MRLGSKIFESYETPEEWAEIVLKNGYGAAYAPVSAENNLDEIRKYADIAAKKNIVIAETGAWSNPISLNHEERKKALLKCKKQLYAADELNARCCVNISGSRGEKWDGPDKDNFSKDTFDMIVQCVREIIDEIKPRRSFYTLETMPWAYPFSADSYLELIMAVDRKSFAVHFDPVNLVSGISTYYNNADMIKDFVKKLGRHIKSCHAKDIILGNKPTVHLDECRPGTGALNYSVLIREISKLPSDVPLMLEHLPTEEEYIKAAEYIKDTAKKTGVKL